MILELSVSVFICQIIFIWSRTLNVRYVSAGNMAGALISGGVVHLCWLLSIWIGVDSVGRIVKDFEWQYIPVVAGSLFGGTLGTYWGMLNKINKK
jgi:hypothetical protein